MAKWRHSLNIKDAWERAKKREISPQDLARHIVNRAKMLRCYDDDFDLQNICNEFESISEDPSADFDDFDVVMSELYDWGDELVGGTNFFNAEKRCWIATF